MRKLLSLLFAAMLAGQAWALSFEVGGLKYTVIEGTNTVTVSKGSTTLPDVLSIPATISDYSVTSIGKNAFQNCSGLTSVTIPNSVTNIG